MNEAVSRYWRFFRRLPGQALRAAAGLLVEEILVAVGHAPPGRADPVVPEKTEEILALPDPKSNAK